MSNVSIDVLASRLREFARQRDWEQFHTPKNLATALSVEASELLEIFQWLTAEESSALSESQLERVKEEVGDVLNYLVRLSDVLGIDLIEAATAKLKVNEGKYPAAKVRGSAKKYTEYSDES